MLCSYVHLLDVPGQHLPDVRAAWTTRAKLLLPRAVTQAPNTPCCTLSHTLFVYSGLYLALHLGPLSLLFPSSLCLHTHTHTHTHTDTPSRSASAFPSHSSLCSTVWRRQGLDRLPLCFKVWRMERLDQTTIHDCPERPLGSRSSIGPDLHGEALSTSQYLTAGNRADKLHSGHCSQATAPTGSDNM